jgi:hypothetical protein
LRESIREVPKILTTSRILLSPRDR